MNITRPEPLPEEKEFEDSLRPKRFGDFIGQEKIKENLSVFVEAAKKRGEPLDHILFFGPPGLGKTTLAYIIANEIGVSIKSISGPILEKPRDLAGILTNLEKGDVLFIDEIHRINKSVEEYLYPAMEDFSLDIMIDSGPNARSLKINLNPFTLIGATTRSGLLTSALRSRFGFIPRVNYYDYNELFKIVLRTAKILGVGIEEDGAWEIAMRSRGTPRIVNRLVRRVRDYADVKGEGIITKEIADYALDMLEVDKAGLDPMDKSIVLAIIEKFHGGPVGVSTLATAVGEKGETIEEVFEPYLILQGFIKRTQRGREATEIAYRHFNIPLPKGKKLF